LSGASPTKRGRFKRANGSEIAAANGRIAHRPCGSLQAAHVPGHRSGLEVHLKAHILAKHLKALLWRTPFQAICEAWSSKERMASFKRDNARIGQALVEAQTSMAGAELKLGSSQFLLRALWNKLANVPRDISGRFRRHRNKRRAGRATAWPLS
jgi:hypothetical protein